MKQGWRYVLAAIGAGALVGSAVSTAMAGKPSPIADQTRAHAPKRTTINGQLYVNDVVRANKNLSVYGTLYAHKNAQVWGGLVLKTGGITVNKDGLSVQAGGLNVVAGGLTVQDGGVKADSLVISGPIQVRDAAVSGNLQAGNIAATGTVSGTSMTLTGGATVGSTLTAAGKITGNGLDAGSGGLTTTGNITAAGLTATSITDTGTFAVHDLSATGNLNAASGTLNNVTFTGNVNFTNAASVTGLNVGAINLTGATVGTLNAGNPSSSTSPLNISANGRTAQLGVNSSGALTVDSLLAGTSLGTTGNLTVAGNSTLSGQVSASSNVSIGGNLTVSGTGGIVTSLVQGTPASGATTPGALTLSGSSITLAGATQANGNLTIGNGANIVLSTVTSGSSTTDSHIAAGGDTDVAGFVIVSINPGGCSSNNGCTQEQSFQTIYTTPPVVTLTAITMPAPPGSSGGPQVWVTLDPASGGGYKGFIVHYVPPTGAGLNAYQVTYDYHVIGGTAPAGS